MVDETSSQDTIKYINIQSLLDAHFVYQGQVSGRQYDWTKAGDIVSVLEEDVPELIKKRLGKKLCCGNGTNQVFEIMGG